METELWIDVETTGLNPKRDYLLEIGVVVTTNLFTKLEIQQFVIGMPDAHMHMDPVVLKIHQNNGLLKECLTSGYYPSWIEAKLIQMKNKWSPDSNWVLVGNSVHFDKSFIQEKMPSFYNLLHYRNIDVSSFKELCKRFYGFEMIKPPSMHRALYDIENSMNELSACLTTIKTTMNKEFMC